MNREALIQTYLQEAGELLEQYEAALLSLETQLADAEILNTIFRAAHTIKGSGGIFGFTAIVAFTHEVENLLARLRDGSQSYNAALGDVLLQCGDHMAALVDEAAAGEVNGTAVSNQRSSELLQQLQQAGDESGAVLPDAPGPASATAVSTELPAEGGVASEAWHVSLRFNESLFFTGNDPLRLIDALGDIADSVEAMPITEGIESNLKRFNPEHCYLGFELRLFGESLTRETILDQLEFVQDEAEIRILPPHGQIREYIELIRKLPEEDARLGEILVACGALTEVEVAQCLALAEPPRLGEVAVGDRFTHQAIVDAAVDKQYQARRKQGNETAHFVRVRADKLDELITAVGEMVMASAAASNTAQGLGDKNMIEHSEALAEQITGVREAALKLRMVQVGETFTRFQRVVRDASRQLGKPVNLITRGGEAELDKRMVEQISDPLTHLVRNAIDHGIESAPRRAAAGKPAQGTITLQAYHDAGSIVIEVRDDGAGLDRQRILAKADEKGLLADGAVLSDQEVYGLIFAPGFSTAEQVSDLSGRGVGMDVVRSRIEALRGRVEVESEPGQGSTFRIRLPLTLAMIDGFLIRAAGTHFIVPLEAVSECVDFTESMRDPSRELVRLREQALPYVRLADFFDLGESTDSLRQSLVVTQCRGQAIGIVVDQLLGEHQTVIKPLGRLLGHVPGVVSSTVLGNGEVAFILDPEAIGQAVACRPATTPVGRHVQTATAATAMETTS